VLVVAALVVLVASCGSHEKAASTSSSGTKSERLCAKLDLAELQRLTGDVWKLAKPAKRYYGCTWEVAEEAAPRIYVTITDVARDDPPLAKRIFGDETRFGGKRTPGIGDRAVYRAGVHELTVLDHNVVYVVQVLSDKQHSPAETLDIAGAIFERVRS
jgi:hypothetical protein